jgi:hypothetical protein
MNPDFLGQKLHCAYKEKLFIQIAYFPPPRGNIRNGMSLGFMKIKKRT